MIDLHSHTTASDGSLTPGQLVQLAGETGLSALGITDHDTVAGLEAAHLAALETRLELVPGIELSVDYGPGQFHLLGYLIDYRDAGFLARLAYLQDNRVNRNLRMVERMQRAGLPITLQDIEREAGGGQVGRPHMAMALVRKGLAASVQDSFDRYLADGRPYHIPKVKLGPEAAIEMVHQAGGIAILAHPKYLRIPVEGDLARELRRLRGCGLDGVEAYYSQHTLEETDLYLRLAREVGLLVSAGSDFHGASKPQVVLGRIHGGQSVGDEILGALKRAAHACGEEAAQARGTAA
jgi:predicted metal-dependent phosphoesterase TrpH